MPDGQVVSLIQVERQFSRASISDVPHLFTVLMTSSEVVDVGLNDVGNGVAGLGVVGFDDGLDDVGFNVGCLVVGFNVGFLVVGFDDVGLLDNADNEGLAVGFTVGIEVGFDVIG